MGSQNHVDVLVGDGIFRYPRVDELFAGCSLNRRVTAKVDDDAYKSTIRDLRKTLQESLAIREDQLTVLNSLMVEMMTYQELDPLLQNIAEIMIERTLANNALILLVDETGEFMQVVASAGSHSRENLGERRHCGVGFAGLAWSSGKTQYIDDSDSNVKTRGFWPSGTQLLAEPLLADGVVIGVAVLGAPTHLKEFGTSRGLVNNLASLAGIAIANAQSLEQSRAELARMRALSDISKRMVSFDNVDELLNSVTRALLDTMDINRAACFRVQGPDRLFVQAAWHKLDTDVVTTAESSSALRVDESICSWCLINREFVQLSRDVQDARMSSEIQALRVEYGVGSILAMPITYGENVVGILSVSRNLSRRNFNENEINLFCSIVNQASSAFIARQMSNALQYQVDHDSLTRLPNRHCFEKELKQQLNQIVSASSLLAVLFLDLDGFKSVNDTMGHARGDQLLQQVSSRLSQCLGDQHLLARIGGDEFAVIARNLFDRQQAISMAFALNKSLIKPFNLDDTAVSIGVSIGISYCPIDSVCADELLKYADEAMYQAKAKAGNEPRIVCFHQRMAQATQQRHEIESELREALANQQFVLHYQPQVNVHNGNVDSVEALLRWNHPTRGWVSPGVFIPIAEDSGLINPVGAWVVSEAVRQLQAWQHTSLAHVRIAVNIAAPQFVEEDFCKDLLNMLAQANVNATQLEIEVTESIVMKDVSAVVKILEQLRAAGIRVSIDDFGTGYSSLSYLRDLPLDKLKIDRAFMEYESAEKIDYTLVRTMILMAEGLGLSTIAEGVESEDQLRQLMDLGCFIIQGFLFSKAVPASELQAAVSSIQRQVENMQSAGQFKAGARAARG